MNNRKSVSAIWRVTAKSLSLSLLCIGAVACNEQATGKQHAAGESSADSFFSFDDAGIGATATNLVSIHLPADESKLTPGPDILLADGGTACFTCHNGTIEETLESPLGRVAFEVTKEGCLECHSADYISSQPPLSSAAWAKTVTKMVDKFDPSAVADYLNPEHQKAMVQYLSTVYVP